MPKFRISLSILFLLATGIQLEKLSNISSQEFDKPRLGSEIPYKIQIDKDATFASNEEVLIGTIYPIYVDKKNRVFIGDADQILIHVFEENGDYVTSLGREGRGPGDYSAISWRTAITSNSGQLYITDSRFSIPEEQMCII